MNIRTCPLGVVAVDMRVVQVIVVIAVPSPPQDEEEEENVIYSYAHDVASTLDASKLKTLVSKYQIPSKFRPRLPKEGKWCCSFSSGFGVYTSYLLAGLRFPLNSFCRGLFHW